MNIDVLCMGCFKEKGDARICPHCGYEEGAQPESPYHLPCKTILNGKYLIGRVLGSGGFGVTYLAWDMNLFVKLAIKEYFPTEMASRSLNNPVISVYSGPKKENFDHGLEKFLDEARILAKFHSHPGIISIRDFFRENGTAYIVMEFVEGITLKQFVEGKGGKLPYLDTLNLIMPVLSSLKEVHDAGMLHRDISPDNIYISSEGKVKLLDFGAARFALSDISKSLSVILKPGYAPYEQYSSKGNQGPWTDIYALAATFYRLITGQMPPDAPDRLADPDNDPLKPPSTLGIEMPKSAELALLKALSIRAAERFQDVDEFKAGILGEIDLPKDAQYQASPTAPIQNNSIESTTQSNQNTNNSYNQQGLDYKKMLPLFLCTAGLIIVLLIGAIFVIGSTSNSDNNSGGTPSSNTISTDTIDDKDDNPPVDENSGGEKIKDDTDNNSDNDNKDEEKDKTPDFSPLDNILNATSNRNYSVFIKDINSGETYSHGNTSDTFPALGEVFIPIAVTSRVNLNEGNTVDFYNSDITADARSNASYYFNNSFSIDKLIEMVLEKSDNTAANKLILQLGNGSYSSGLSAINKCMSDAGCTNTTAGRILLDTGASTDNYTSAKDMALIFEKLLDTPGLMNFTASCAPEKNDAIKNELSSHSDLKIMSKFGIAPKGYRGSNQNIYHCCAGIQSGDSKIKFVIAVMSSGYGDNNSAYDTVGELATKAYSILSNMNN